ncbi:MAG: hypothetical protein C4540_05890 [Candidatus Omnitrophota bacterium]|jgi:Tfp pilus assembly protein PilX|nr:MAG: hypothetical protein C4540_05890 [Candidatus Omnitrophota bacterium]
MANQRLYVNKGMVLILVLVMILIAVILSNVILTIMSNQEKLTHHKVTRIQAIYAAQAAANYAIDKFRRNDNPATWPLTGTYSRTMCRASCTINEPSLPPAIKNVTLIINNSVSFPGTRQITATVYFQ